MRPTLREYHEVFTGIIARERLEGTGVLTREDAISFGATGGTGVLRAGRDVRKRHPYAMYAARWISRKCSTTRATVSPVTMVRMREIEQSMDIIEQLIDTFRKANTS